MTSTPPHLTFSFDSPSGTLTVAVSAASDELLTLVAPLDTPRAALAILYAAALTWCNERPGYYATVDNSTISIGFPLASPPLDAASFIESFKAGLLNVGKPTSEITTNYGSLAYYEADETHAQDILRFLSLLDKASQDESFANISRAAASWNDNNPRHQIACTRVNSIITIAAISGQTFSDGDMEGIVSILRPSTHRAMQASAAPMPMPSPQETEPAPAQPPSVPLTLPDDGEETQELVGA